MFRTVIEKNALLEPLSQVIGVTEKKSLMPYLSNVLIRFGRQSYIYATDLEISAIAYLTHQTEEEKTLVVHAKKLFDILRELDKGEIKLTAQENSVMISQGKSEFVLTVYDPDEFPEARNITSQTKFSLMGEEFLELLESVAFAMGTDESRYVLTGVYMKADMGKLTIVATDGYRMALIRKDCENCPLFSGFIIPSKTVRELQKILRGEDNVLIEVDETGVGFSTEKVKLVSRVIEGQYPDYEAAIPRHNRFVLKAEKEALCRGLKKVSAIMSKNEPILFKVDENMVEISSESEGGRAKETIDAHYTGEKKELHFNVRFLLEAVSHIRTDSLTIRLPEEYGAILIEESERQDYLNVIMPIKV